MFWDNLSISENTVITISQTTGTTQMFDIPKEANLFNKHCSEIRLHLKNMVHNNVGLFRKMQRANNVCALVLML